MRPTVLLAPIVGVLGLGCSGPCFRSFERRVNTASVSWEELAAALDEDGQLTTAGCQEICVQPFLREVTIHGCELADEATTVAETGETGETADTGARRLHTVLCDVTGKEVCKGRHHVSVAERPEPAAGDPIGVHLARSAQAEAASVQAFVALVAELTALGAPSELVQRCREAALDEVAHARAVGRLAAERGVAVPPPRFVPVPARGLLALAIENAVEGCVKETFAAFVAAHQAQHADPALRPIYAVLAEDELRHAELAWAIDAWAMDLLPPDDRALVEVARAAAVDALSASVGWPGELRSLGLPDARSSRQILDVLAARLWSADPSVAA